MIHSRQFFYAPTLPALTSTIDPEKIKERERKVLMKFLAIGTKWLMVAQAGVHTKKKLYNFRVNVFAAMLR